MTIRTPLTQSSFARSTICALFVAAILISSSAQARESAAEIDHLPQALSWRSASSGPITLTISGPGAFYVQRTIAEDTIFDLAVDGPAGQALPDGTYSWEAIAQSDGIDREFGGQAGQAGVRNGLTNSADSGLSTSRGTFAVRDGSIVDPTAGQAEPGTGDPVGPSLAAKDVLFIDDLIVTQRQCVGGGCANGETFSGETVRLKHFNTRLSFIDTSGSSYPTRDWQLVANDSTPGGRDRFSIEDITSGRTPFTVEGNAPADAIYLEDGGNVGFGTSTPGRSLHLVKGDSPGLRLQQDASQGFGTATWDIVGNESNFFIGNSAESRFVFQIRPDAPTRSLTIDDDGDVGIGIIDASAALHVNSTTTATDAAEILVRNTGANTAIRSMLRLENAGRPEIVLTNTASGNEWKYTALDAGFQISKSGTGVAEMLLENDGDLIISGVVRDSSDRNTKRAIVPVDPQDILQKVVQLPIATWNRKTDDPWVRSLGPMAQDFSRLFALGPNHLTISPLDVASAGLASVQALNQMVSQQGKRIEALESMNRALIERLEYLIEERDE